MIKLKCSHKYRPTVKHHDDVGFDIYTHSTLALQPGVNVYKTGIIVRYIKPGYWIKIFDKSGIPPKVGLTVEAGVIDTGYRGEIGVIINNPSVGSIVIPAGVAIAQGVVLAANYPLNVVQVNGRFLKPTEKAQRNEEGGVWRETTRKI